MDTERFCQHCGKPFGAKAVHGLCPECLMQVGMGSEPGVEGGPKGFVPPTPEELAPHFPQLEDLEFHGKGGMGAVYKARQKNLNRLVALKVLPPNAGRDPAFAERFTREAQALAQLSHPGILTIHEFGHAGGFYYFVMEFVDGVNLRQLLRAQRLSPREAMAIVPQICEALQYAHDRGIVHRDIKPENVLVDKQGRVKIADFGLAKLLGREGQSLPLTQSAEVMGTPQYMAPEQLERPLEVDHRADIYSLGVVFYEMLTGELPLGRFPVPSRKVQVDVRLGEIVLRALEKEPELRYQQARVFKTEVETVAQAAGSGSPAAAHASRPRANRSEARTTWYGPLALGLFLAGTLGTLALMSLSPREEPALVFGALALCLAVVFAWMSRRERLGRFVLFTVGGAVCLAGAIAAVSFSDPCADAPAGISRTPAAGAGPARIRSGASPAGSGKAGPANHQRIDGGFCGCAAG
ncbi:MAG TPA: serine/threonine protein kinase [Verrucomicrobia bacterium]|nr:serine/threonine protein kinase [Verrucomicrobiota bacterium]